LCQFMPADVPTPSHDARPGAVNEMKKDGSHLERRQPDSNRGECGGKAGIGVGSTVGYERVLWDLEQEIACKMDLQIIYYIRKLALRTATTVAADASTCGNRRAAHEPRKLTFADVPISDHASVPI